MGSMNRKTFFHLLGLTALIIGMLVYIEVAKIPKPYQVFTGQILSATASGQVATPSGQLNKK